MFDCAEYILMYVVKSYSFQMFIGGLLVTYLFLIERKYKEREMLKRWKTIMNKVIKFQVRSTAPEATEDQPQSASALRARYHGPTASSPAF